MSKKGSSGPGDKSSALSSRAFPAGGFRRFNALSFADQLQQLRLADSSMRYRMLLEAADGTRLVRALPAQDLFLMIKELGREELTDVLAMVSGAQLTSFIDLDCWHGDRLDAPEALQWLGLAMTGGEEKVLEAARAVDFDLLVMILQRFVRVVRGPEAFLDEDNPPDAARCIGSYEVENLQPKYARLVASLLDCLFRLDQEFYHHLMEALRWELPTSLAEAVFQGRTGRLMDLGFPDPDQVLEVYAFIDPDRFDVAGYRRSSGWQADEVSPGFVLTATRPGDLLAEVLAAGVNAETGWELTCLVNRVLAADKAEVGDRSQVRAAMDRVFGCLNLALEHLCGSDVRQATQLFAETWLLPLFRLGHSLTLRLRRRARQLREASIGPYLDEPLAGFLATLARDCPRYPAGLDDSPQAADRPFRNLADVRRAEQCLAETEALRRLFEEHFSFPLPAPAQLDLADCHPAEVEAVGLRHFFLTALANRLLGRPFDPSPLAPEDLSLLHARVCRAGQLRDDLRGETRSWLEKLEPDAWPFADFCLQAWNENLCPLRADRLDPRFLEGLLVKSVPSR